MNRFVRQPGRGWVRLANRSRLYNKYGAPPFHPESVLAVGYQELMQLWRKVKEANHD
jgi:hypothetical protein